MTRREFEQKLALLWISRLEPGSSASEPAVTLIMREVQRVADVVEKAGLIDGKSTPRPQPRPPKAMPALVKSGS